MELKHIDIANLAISGVNMRKMVSATGSMVTTADADADPALLPQAA